VKIFWQILTYRRPRHGGEVHSESVGSAKDEPVVLSLAGPPLAGTWNPGDRRHHWVQESRALRSPRNGAIWIDAAA
jgi:hypothetical protein